MDGDTVTDLSTVARQIESLPPEERRKVEAEARTATQGMKWLPNPGPQTEAYFSKADEVFYGGEAGGGKTDLLLGTALNNHRRARIMRRLNGEVQGLIQRMEEIVGQAGLKRNAPAMYRTKSQIINFSGCQFEKDWKKYQGSAQDFFGFDEITNFTRQLYTTLIAWNRSAFPKQRSRVICTGNPPTTPEGMWVIEYWAPWLDPEHPNPALPGELRWFTTINGKDTEVDGPGPVTIDGVVLKDERGEPILPKSRTFIPAELKDNPDLAETDYAARLSGLPEELRRSLKLGEFRGQMEDAQFQCFPSEWVDLAMNRWNPSGRDGPMNAVGVDVAQGGEDKAAICPRHGNWFDLIQTYPGREVPDGPTLASKVIAIRRDPASVSVDMGGGYGISTRDHLKSLVPVEEFNGSASAEARVDKSGMLKFLNIRAAAHWHLRELLDPSGGHNIAIPPDPDLRQELLTVRYIPGQKIKIEPKEDVIDRLGRSPDKLDALIMAAFARGETKAGRFGNTGALQQTATTSGRNPRRR